jgi:hypothetical protein
MSERITHTNEHISCGYASPVEFLIDREEPMNAAALSAYFEEITGRKPSAVELRRMKPNTPGQVAEQAAWYSGDSWED